MLKTHEVEFFCHNSTFSVFFRNKIVPLKTFNCVRDLAMAMRTALATQRNREPSWR